MMKTLKTYEEYRYSIVPKFVTVRKNDSLVIMIIDRVKKDNIIPRDIGGNTFEAVIGNAEQEYKDIDPLGEEIWDDNKRLIVTTRMHISFMADWAGLGEEKTYYNYSIELNGEKLQDVSDFKAKQLYNSFYNISSKHNRRMARQDEEERNIRDNEERNRLRNILKEQYDIRDPYNEEDWEDENSLGLPYKYKTQITIQDPVIKGDNPRDTYKIVIDNMHGDADAYTTKVVYENNIEEVEKIVNFLHWCDHGRVNRTHISDVGRKLFGGDGLYEIIDSDMTCDGQYDCRPSLKKITYFDKEGIELKVRIRTT